MAFTILIGIDTITAVTVLYFFVEGLGDGSVSSFNGGLWALILLGIGSIIGGGFALRRAGRTRMANALLAVLAVPAALFGLFFLILILSGPRWN